MLLGVENLGADKARAYVAKRDGESLHTDELRESNKIGALHLLGGGVGGCCADAHSACNGGDDSNVSLTSGGVGRVVSDVVDEVVDDTHHTLAVGLHGGELDMLIQSSVLATYARGKE